MTLTSSILSLESLWPAKAPLSPAITISMSTYSKLKYLASVFKHLNGISIPWLQAVGVADSLREACIKLVLNQQVLILVQFAIENKVAP